MPTEEQTSADHRICRILSKGFYLNRSGSNQHWLRMTLQVRERVAFLHPRVIFDVSPFVVFDASTLHVQLNNQLNKPF